MALVGNEKFHAITEAAPIAAYSSLAQAPARGGQSLLVRTTDPNALAGAVRAAIGEIDPCSQSSASSRSPTRCRHRLGPNAFCGLVLGIFATLALVLAAIGITAS